MPEITPIATHKEDTLNRLIQQYRTEIFVENPLIAYIFTTIQKIINVYTAQIQELEGLLSDLDIRIDLDNAEGVYLDAIGDIVQQSRTSLDDAIYRIFIKGKIIVNTSNGTPEQLISASKLLTGSAEIFLLEYFPAAVSVMGTTPIIAGLEQIMHDMLKKAVPVGVLFDYIGTYEEDNAFSFDGDPDGKGFGELHSQGVNTSVVPGLLVDSGASFISDGVGVGDVIQNITDGLSTTVIAVNSEMVITITDDIFTGFSKEYYIVDSIIGGKFAYIYDV